MNTSREEQTNIHGEKRTPYERKASSLVSECADRVVKTNTRKNILLYGAWTVVAIATVGAANTLINADISPIVAIPVAVLIHVAGVYAAELLAMGGITGNRMKMVGGSILMTIFVVAIGVLFALRAGWLGEDGGSMSGLAIAVAILAVEILASVLGLFVGKAKQDLEDANGELEYVQRFALDIVSSEPAEQDNAWTDAEDALDFHLQKKELKNNGSNANKRERETLERRLARLQEAHPGRRFKGLRGRPPQSPQDGQHSPNGKMPRDPEPIELR